MDKLVSILVPCYNMGEKIYRLLDSIYKQNYDNIELIIVDDGSTDNSKEVIDSYQDKFTNKGISLSYIYQTNKGLGGAIDTGLKYITGEYFCWPDADDFLASNSIKKRVDFLEKNKEYGLVRSDAYLYNENDLINPIGYITKKHKDRFKEENLLVDYILERNIIFCPGCHMVRTAAFKSVNPTMSIFPGPRGQNYQLLLPLVWKYKFGYIDDPLYNYVIYNNSMSSGDDTFQKIKIRYDGLQTIIIETLKRMNLSKKDYERYSKLTYDKYHMWKMREAVNFGEKTEFINNYKEMDSAKPFIIIILRMMIEFPLFLFLMKRRRMWMLKRERK